MIKDWYVNRRLLTFDLLCFQTQSVPHYSIIDFNLYSPQSNEKEIHFFSANGPISSLFTSEATHLSSCISCQNIVLPRMTFASTKLSLNAIFLLPPPPNHLISLPPLEGSVLNFHDIYNSQ